MEYQKFNKTVKALKKDQKTVLEGEFTILSRRNCKR